jgi:hypothetical protein
MNNEKANQNNSAQNQQIAQAAEAKTVMNGKTIPLKQAQAAEEAAAQQNTQTGIQAHHDNSSEAVQAGKMGSNQAAQETSQFQVKQVNVQSGQQDMQQFMNQNSMSNEQVQAKEDKNTVQGALDNKAAKAKTKKAD